MIDIKYVKENIEKVKKATEDKGFNPNLVDEAVQLYDIWTQKIQAYEALRSQRNKIAHESRGFSSVGKELKEQLSKTEAEVLDIYQKYLEAVNQIPNPARSDVKVGKGEEDNEEIKKWGEIPKFDFEPKDHLTLGTNLGILDFETGAKVTGSQFYYLYGDGAFLELALTQYAFETLQKEGFKPVITPDLAKSRYYLGTGYMPRGNEAQTYQIKDTDIGLIATAEVTLAGKHADEIIPKDKLPLKYIGYSHVFRQEEGSYGKYSKGLYRVHEFTKAEMFIYCLPEESDKMHDYLLSLEEKIYRDLGIPYRVIKQCTADLGAMAARKYDIEAWMPGRSDYGEVTSTSNCTDYQARNLNIKFKNDDNKNEYVHMLNGTAIATSRTIIAILENFQEKDGSVRIPKVLQKWMGKEKISTSSGD